LKTVSGSGHNAPSQTMIMITGTDDHDPPEILITINWIA
jgi:hypothetical protein